MLPSHAATSRCGDKGRPFNAHLGNGGASQQLHNGLPNAPQLRLDGNGHERAFDKL
jgi:hypothetical protein